MTNIQVISASAGSGKTYQLTQELTAAIVRGEITADRVIVTTFTKKAAAEIQERVRVALLRQGLTDAARDILAARIGTVHAICGELIQDFAFDLGLSPALRVLDAGSATRSMEAALADVVTDDALEQLAALESRMHDFDWREDVRTILERARTNGIDADALREMKDRSWSDMRGLLSEPVADGDRLDEELAEACDRFLESAKVVTRTGTKDFCHKIRGIPRALRKHSVKWKDWVTLIKAPKSVTKDARPFADELAETASKVLQHPQLHRDIQESIHLCFEIAADALGSYGEHKRRSGVIDFADQEAYALRILKDPALESAVAERLAPRFDLLLVDEFQDTSPIQLAIFLQLAKHVKRSVWVGDQKQAIYGFRGSDPALMDAVIQHLSPDPDVLKTSWRSVPDLIELTSSVFAQVFPQQGIPEHHVRLTPASDDIAIPPGPVIERWVLDSDKIAQDAQALASCVDQLVQDPSVQVRDRATGELRGVRPDDVAVLCRRNDHCVAVADALTRLGHRAVLSRPGLLNTAEGRVALSGLRLFVDPRDRLAAAELLRFVRYPDDPDGWLAEQLDVDGEPDRLLQLLKAQSQANPTAGPVEALDLCIETLGLADLCHRWDNTEMRLANLDQLRAHVKKFVSSQASQRRPVTTRALVEYLIEIRAAGVAQIEARFIDKMIAARRLTEAGWAEGGRLPTDTQAHVETTDAVHVETWHGAKGMEWPIVVLTELGEPRPVSALGVHVISDDVLELHAPLAGRRVRYWPQPFDGMQKNHPLFDALDTHPATVEAREEDQRQLVRLLYVGMTRARDRLGLAARAGDLASGILDLLRDASGQPVATEFDARFSWAGTDLPSVCRTGVPAADRPVPAEAVATYRKREVVDHPAAIVNPSAIEAEELVTEIGEFVKIGDRIPLRGTPDMTAVGQALHGFFAADDPAWDDERRREVAGALLERWGVASHVATEDVVRASTNLAAWVQSRWPGAACSKEVPIRHRLASGSEVRGLVDLVVQAEDECAVVDHKTFPGGVADAKERVPRYGPQLMAYSGALGGRGRVSTWIHLPVLGAVVSLRPEPK